MGIKPDGDFNLTTPSSTPQERFQDMANDLENVGDKAGEAWGEMYTESTSANAGAAELAADLTALEQKVSVLESVNYAAASSNPRLTAHRKGHIVMVNVNGAIPDSDITSWRLPEWARPLVTTSVVPVNTTGQVYVGTDGVFTLVGLAGKNVRFTTTFIAAN